MPRTPTHATHIRDSKPHTPTFYHTTAAASTHRARTQPRQKPSPQVRPPSASVPQRSTANLDSRPLRVFFSPCSCRGAVGFGTGPGKPDPTPSPWPNSRHRTLTRRFHTDCLCCLTENDAAAFNAVLQSSTRVSSAGT
ncbi:hypothetical protein NQL31_001906 [Lotmaria passim]